MQEPEGESVPLQGKGSLKDRMKQYEEAARRKKEIERKHQIEVGQLDDSMTDVTKFVSPTKKTKKKIDVSIHKLDEDLKLEFENSYSNLEGEDPDKCPVSPRTAWKSKPQKEKDAEEKKAKEDLVEVLNEDEETAKEICINAKEKVHVKSFSSLRKGYLTAINQCRPETAPPASSASEGKKPFSMKKADRKKEAQKVKQYQRLIGAWDSYEKRAQDKPEEPSPEDKKIEEEVKKVEETVNDEWQDYAREIVVQKQHSSDSDSDDDDDDMEFWLAEAKRLKAEKERKRLEEEERLKMLERERKRKAKEEMQKRLEEEDDDIVAEAMRLREEAKKKKAAEKDASKGKPDFTMRPGMQRGTSFEDDPPKNDEAGSDHSAHKGQANLGMRPGMRGNSFGDESSSGSDDSDEDHSKRKHNANYSMRPNVQRGTSFDDDKLVDVDTESDGGSDGDHSAHKSKANYSMRPGMQRGTSFDDDKPADNDNESDDESDGDRSAQKGEANYSMRPTTQRGTSFDDGTSFVDDDGDDNDDDEKHKSKSKKSVKKKKGQDSDSDYSSESDDESGKKSKSKSKSSKKDKKNKKDKKEKKPKSKWLSKKADDSSSSNSSSGCSSDEEEEDFKTPPKSKKKKVKNIELKEDVLDSPKTPRNMDGTLWNNPLRFWSNKPNKKVKIVGNQLSFKVPAKTDCWRKTRHNFIMDNAPFHSQKVIGDFECIVKVFGGFSKMYDKAGIMVRFDEENWILSGMEWFNDRVNHSTSVTHDFTDWSLSALPEKAEKAGVWFCVKRVGNSYEAFYSFNGKSWVQTRQGIFTERPVVHVGICAACPMGDEFKVTFEGYQLKTL